MKLSDAARLLLHIARWRSSWGRVPDTSVPAGLGATVFRTVADAVAAIPDSATVVSCGLAANARCSVFFQAVRDRFRASGHPCGLTWISVGAQGGRGRVPGTVEELALPGLVTRYITGHAETAKALLQLADAGELELHAMPQGELALLIEAQATGVTELRSPTGVGTFLDLRVGGGSPVTPNASLQLIEPDGDALLYRLPKIDVALFNAPYADAEGNVYFRHAATITENREAARAARANGGLVMAAVADIVEHDRDAVSLPRAAVDAIVVNPDNEQTGSVPQRRYWPLFTAEHEVDERDAEAKLKFVNRVLGITPRRGRVEEALARLAASVFVEQVPRDATVNIGVGFPEEVCRLVFEHGLHSELTFTTETGVYGGLPAPGIFFGAAVNPRRLESSAWMFRHYREHLDAALLGILQVDSAGNVNVSRRGPKVIDYVGPGGFPSIVNAARTVILVGTWMAGAKLSIEGGRVRVVKAGRPKFIERVDEITFNAAEASKAGKRVFYVTSLGVLRLTEHGLELVAVMPGVDIERDLLANATATIHLPRDPGPRVVDSRVVTGAGFDLVWPDR